MKGMLYLCLAIVSSAMVSVCMRATEKAVRGTMVMFTANYAVCLLLSRLYMGDARLFAAREGLGLAAGLGLISGALYLLNFVLLRRNIRQSGVVLSSASMKLGAVLVPVVAAMLLFQERMRGSQLAGAALAVAAILLINLEKDGVRQGGKKAGLLLLLAVSGVTDTMANLYDKTGAAALKNHYLFYTFLAAMALAILLALRQGEKPRVPDVLAGALIGVPNYFSARFILLALGQVPAVVVYPVYSVGTIVLITLIGIVAFRERLNRRKAIAMGLILAALALLNLP